MNGFFPGWPGPVFHGRRSQIGNVAMPGLPALPAVPLHPNGAPAAGPAQPALSGLAAYGVPVTQAPGGQMVVQSIMDPGQMMPPQVPGMPQMPGPPDWFLNGTSGGSGGLFQPMLPVAPFDPGNQVGQMQQRPYEGA